MENLMKYIDSHQDEAVNFLRRLISFDTSFIEQGVDGREKEAQEWLEKRMHEWGFETELFEPSNEHIKNMPDYNPGHNYENRPNLVAIHYGSGGGKSIILNGHMDTVPLDDIRKWKYHPLSATVDNGKIYGRGACDMKAGLAAMILAVKFLNDCQIEHCGNIIIESVVDEEGGGNGTLSCIKKGYHADAAIVTEPTNLDIYSASRGVYLLEIEVEGKPAHACFKWQGVNAIEKGFKIVSGLKELETRWLALRKNPYLPSPTIGLGEIHGGISAATVPGTCQMRFDIKYLPYEIDEQGNKVFVKGEKIKEEVENCIDRICQGDEWLCKHPVRKKWYLSVMPHSIEMDHPIIEIARSSSMEVMGRARVSGLPSGADARHLQNTGQIPTILFGPGDMKNAHSINEWVSIKDYIDSIKILAKIILYWTNRKGDIDESSDT